MGKPTLFVSRSQHFTILSSPPVERYVRHLASHPGKSRGAYKRINMGVEGRLYRDCISILLR